MTPETETASPAAGINVWDRSDATITLFYDTTIESSARNGVQGRGQVGFHQGSDGRGRCFYFPSYTSLIRNSKVEVDSFGSVLGTTSYQR